MHRNFNNLKLYIVRYFVRSVLEMQALNLLWVVELIISGGQRVPGFHDAIDEGMEPVSGGAFFLT